MSQPYEEKFDYRAENLPLSIMTTHLKGGNTAIPSHWHERIELFYVISGEGQVRINLITYPIKAGDVVVVSPGAIHSVNIPDGGELLCKVLIFDGEIISENPSDPVYREYVDPLIRRKITFKAVLSNSNQLGCSVQEKIKGIIDKYSEHEPCCELYVKGALFDIFYMLFRWDLAEEIKEAPNQTVKKMWDVLEYIETNYQESISVDDLAAVADYSKFHFLRLFREYIGLTPIQYINRVRLEQAAKMLINTDDTITQISFSAGFKNVSYFIRTFSERYGVSPLKYRKDRNKCINDEECK